MSPAATLVEALEPLRSDPSHAAVLLDIDGTLAPIVRHADDAHVPEATRTLLIEIAKRYGLVGCVSGRRAQAARQIVAIGTIAYIGNHGGELLRPGATSVELDSKLAAWSERVREFAARAYTAEHQRLRIRTEDKQAIAAFHWRGAPDEQAAAAAVREIAARAEGEGLVVHWGRKVLEVRPPVALNKGLGVTGLLGHSPEGGSRDAVDGPMQSTDGAARSVHGAVRSTDGTARSVHGTARSVDGALAVDGTADLAHRTAKSVDGALSADGTARSAEGKVARVADGSRSGARTIDAAVYVGDDMTDLDAFRALRALERSGALKSAVCVAVDSEEAPPDLVGEADLTIDGTSGVRGLLEALL